MLQAGNPEVLTVHVFRDGPLGGDPNDISELEQRGVEALQQILAGRDGREHRLPVRRTAGRHVARIHHDLQKRASSMSTE